MTTRTNQDKVGSGSFDGNLLLGDGLSQHWKKSSAQRKRNVSLCNWSFYEKETFIEVFPKISSPRWISEQTTSTRILSTFINRYQSSETTCWTPYNLRIHRIELLEVKHYKYLWKLWIIGKTILLLFIKKHGIHYTRLFIHIGSEKLMHPEIKPRYPYDSEIWKCTEACCNMFLLSYYQRGRTGQFTVLFRATRRNLQTRVIRTRWS